MVKNFPASAGDVSSIPESGKSPEEETATHSSILAWKRSMDRGAWRATVHGVTQSQIGLSAHTTHTHTHTAPIVSSVVKEGETGPQNSHPLAQGTTKAQFLQRGMWMLQDHNLFVKYTGE